MTKPQRYGTSAAPRDDGIFCLYAEYEKMVAECEALRADAERYRWLRKQPNDTTAPRIDVVQWQEADESLNEGHGLRLEELDAHIDAARKEPK